MLKALKNITSENIRKMLMIFTVIIFLLTIAIGNQAYISSREAILENVYNSNMDLARAFRDYSATNSSQLNSENNIIDGLRTAWKSMDRSVEGGFLCVIDQKGKLTLHTSAPHREGVDVGKNIIHPTNRETLKNLVLSKKDFVGLYLSSSGQEQIAAFAYVPSLDSVISIHVPYDNIQEQINKTTLPWIIGLMIIGGLLLPLSNFLLHRVYVFSQTSSQRKSELLEKENIERKKAEINLQQKVAENTLILDGVVEAVITISERGIIRSFNNAAENMFGYSTEEVIGKNVSLLMSEPEHSHHDQFLVNYLLTGKAKIIGAGRNVTAKNKNGENFLIHLSVNELPKGDDEQRCFIGSCLDITKQVATEEQLRRSQKMDALGKLTGGIAHDYNNMLGVILGYTELLENEVKEGDAKKHVAEIIRATNRAAVLTKKFLAFSRNEPGHPELLNLNQILLSNKDMIEKTLTVRIDLVYKLCGELWDVYVDHSEFEDSILNIVINGMHAMPDGGRLVVESSNTHLEQYEADILNVDTGDYVKISICDNGEGISEDVQSHIFDPFFTTKRTTKNKGSGLGLSQVYSFAKRYNGIVKLYSELGEGTCLNLLFPRKEGSHKNKETSTNKTENLEGSESILVVDDEIALVKLAENILNAEGYKIFTAVNGHQALNILENEKIDVLISDVIMPEMDGYELISIVDEKYPNVKSMLVSGFSDITGNESSEIHKKAITLHKPYNSLALLQAIRKLIER